MTEPSPALQEALTLLIGAGTWHELRRSLQERKLDQAMGPEDMRVLLDAWHTRQTNGMSDTILTRELLFWANGGSFETHMDGFLAPPPAALLEAALARRWFVRRLPSGALVCPPDHPPISLKSIDVVAR